MSAFPRQTGSDPNADTRNPSAPDIFCTTPRHADRDNISPASRRRFSIHAPACDWLLIRLVLVVQPLPVPSLLQSAASHSRSSPVLSQIKVFGDYAASSSTSTGAVSPWQSRSGFGILAEHHATKKHEQGDRPRNKIPADSGTGSQTQASATAVSGTGTEVSRV
jgi:hypothetical protein